MFTNIALRLCSSKVYTLLGPAAAQLYTTVFDAIWLYLAHGGFIASQISLSKQQSYECNVTMICFVHDDATTEEKYLTLPVVLSHCTRGQTAKSGGLFCISKSFNPHKSESMMGHGVNMLIFQSEPEILPRRPQKRPSLLLVPHCPSNERST